MPEKREGLINRRKELGLTQSDMARQLGISQKAYGYIENGKCGISMYNCLKISETLRRNAFVLLNRIDNDLNIYDKDEQLKLLWVFINNARVIDMLRVEDSKGGIKDLSLDEFSNILYYRYIQKYSPSIVYMAQGSEELKLKYVKNKAESFQSWCENQGEFGQNIIDNAELPYGITLADFSRCSAKKIKIKCPKHGVYEQVIGDITNYKRGCPKCTAHGTSYIEQYIYWSIKQIYKNTLNRHKIDGLEVDIFIPEKNICIEYNGQAWHEGKEHIDLYKKEHIEFLGYNFITINEHYKKGDNIFNGGNEIDFYYIASNRNERLRELVCYIVDELLKADSSLIDFKEVENKAWEYSKGKIDYEDSVANKFPCLVKEWDDSNYIKPEDITPGSGKYIKWRCSQCGMTWQRMVANRTYQKSGCPYCGWNSFTGKNRNEVLYEDSVANKFPCLVKEWDEANTITPDSVSTGSGKRILWKCSQCGRTWETMIASRIYSKSGCTSCGYNVFTDLTNNRSKCGERAGRIHHKREPVAFINGTEIFLPRHINV